MSTLFNSGSSTSLHEFRYVDPIVSVLGPNPKVCSTSSRKYTDPVEEGHSERHQNLPNSPTLVHS